MSRNERFDPGAVARITIGLAWATLELTSDSVERMQLLVAGTPEDVDDLKIRLEAGTLSVEQPAYGLSTRINTERWLQVTLRIPADWKGEITASTMSGPLRATGLSGSDFSVSTISGGLRASGLQAMTLSLRTVSGPLNAADLEADSLSLRTVSGSLSVERAAAQKVKVTSVSADIGLSLIECPERVDINSVSGDTALELPADGAKITLHSVSGKLRTAGVSLTDGDPVISATTVAGNLTVACRRLSENSDSND